ncbi:MAG: ATP-binding protein [Pseudonocardiales bacterium]|nr:ATP-binding protein [Pseudonocardiales bacterium]
MPEPPTNPATSRERRQPLRLTLPADPVAPSVARQQVREWLAAWSWPADQSDDIMLAVSEAVSNAIEYAYLEQPPGVVDIRGGVETTPDGGQRATITVRDHGRWRPAPCDDENRRRGIPLMHACMATVAITQPNDRPGTQVVLRSKPLPPPTP